MIRGTTQGGLASPKLFNVVVDRVVRHWLSLKVEDKYAFHDGIGMKLGRIMGLFYAD